MEEPKYDHSSIKKLGDIEHIRKNKGMYIGESNNPNHLIYEIIDNALDEAQGGHATLLGIQIDTKEDSVTIADNGRGIPIDKGTIHLVATSLHTGGKFEKGESGVYKIASGLHGIGIVAVTALSNRMGIEVYRDGKHAVYEYVNARKMKEEVTDHTGKTPFSTQVSFIPDKQYFESLKFDIPALRDRLHIACIHTKNLRCILIVDGNKEVIDSTLEQYFQEEILDKTFKVEDSVPVLEFSSKIKDERLTIRFCWDFTASTAKKCSGCVNMLRVNQGTHINRVFDMFRNVLSEEIKKDASCKILGKDDMLTGLRCYVSLMLYTPEYTSQTKEKLSTNKKNFDALYDIIQTKLTVFLKKNPSYKERLLSFFKAYRRRLSSRAKIVVTNGDGVVRLNTSIDSNLRDCNTHNVSISELFIVEGSSASGTLLQCRDPKIHAILSLRGKILNVASEKRDYLKNKEVLDIINSIGTGIEPDFSFKGLRYGKILLAQDADSDGNHISVLLMTLFLKLVPKLVERGVFYKAIMPLYGVDVKNTFVPFYTEEDMKAYKDKHRNAHIQRYKGLGEMNPDQLRVCLIDPTRQLRKITMPKNPKLVFELMMKSDLKRKLV